MPLPTTILALLLSLPLPALAGPTFRVSNDASTRPISGRLIVLLIKDGAHLRPGAVPIDGPFWDDPQPLYGLDIKDLAPGSPTTIDDSASSTPVKVSELPPGAYTAQARLDTTRLDSEWKRSPGNLFSDPVKFTIEKDAANAAPIVLSLTHATNPKEPTPAEGVEFFSTPSKLLFDFLHRTVTLRAGVVLPLSYDPKSDRRYAAIYEVPGFGGNHEDAAHVAHQRTRLAANSDERTLAENTFWIVLDPESENGHTLFADSANNGPRGRALVEELIPALEAKYHLIPAPTARLLRGHSSGGWSTLWLALTYPDTFAATWSTSPDPVSFHKLQLVDVYTQTNFYSAPASQLTPPASDLPSYRSAGHPLMTIRQENQAEEVLGPDNTSAQQWDSWFAVFGPQNDHGHPAALFDPATGTIDRAIADQYKKYDILELVNADPGKYALLFDQRIRLYVGDQDSFYLNEAVALLKPAVEAISFLHFPEGQHGVIKILPGYDHGSIFTSPELRAIPTDMLGHLRRNKHIPS
jgi:pimeloyl-ACP methyl ester carboxylesterase